MVISDSSEDSGRELSDNEEAYVTSTTYSSNSTIMNKFEVLVKASTSEEHCKMFERLKKILNIDIISSLYDFGAYIPLQHICRYLDMNAILHMELVSKEWNNVLKSINVWRELIRAKIQKDPLWHDIGYQRKWLKYVENDSIANKIDPVNFRILYMNILHDINTLKKNWSLGRYHLEKIHCQSTDTSGVYCIQYDKEKIIAGLRDNTAKIFDMETKSVQGVLSGHTGSVLCLQYDDKYLVTGSSDATVRIWEIENRLCVKVLYGHKSGVLNLRFKKNRLLTCSKDSTIKVWDFENILDPKLINTLSYHRGAINAVEFDDKYILSASGDRILSLWCSKKLEFLHAFSGHQRGIASLHYDYPLAATGSSDFCIRMWNVDTRSCIQIVQGNEELVRCIRFNHIFLASGSYDGKIHIWNMKSLFTFNAQNPGTCTYIVLHKHEGRVFKVLFDRLKLVSSSHDDTIIFWNFLEKDYELPNYWNPFKITAIECELANS